MVGLAAGGSNIELFAAQIVEFNPEVVALPAAELAEQLTTAIKNIANQKHLQMVLPQIITGADAATQLAGQKCDVLLNAITGAAGLEPTLAALNAGNILALANKESLVIGGHLVTSAAKPGQLVAVDSEHSAFAQALRAGRSDEVAKLILTASGGPFRGYSRADLAEVTPEQAMAHPTWNMGRVITINSATLVNKGLELLEAALLYGVDLDDIVVTVHPQSVIHSMVEFFDGSTIAQASPPDMRLPIGLALTWPDRLAGVVRPCDWTKAAEWTFEPLDNAVFPAVELARDAGKAGGSAPAVYNAANEVCVDAFCAGKISFLAITEIIEEVLNKHLRENFVGDAELNVPAVLAADSWARKAAEELC
ncbi:MAG: 1-deoxy-D-xylulose-5-phosphate reductoisomerase [Propionibacterium sp.]|nr:MAG: 1-deoxy-D-xylulose-5-phosphate reductoisomerase [Propionibacterium sp.]